MTDWKKLQNGSDIRGVALAGVEGEDVNLTSEVAGILGRCFVAWLSKRNNKQHISVSVGHDPRLSSTQVKDAVIEGLEASGAKAFDCELASTPAMFMTTIDNESPVDGAIMVTASHLPWNRNGLKFFTPAGGLDSPDISEILEYAQNGAAPTETDNGTLVPVDYMSKYADNLREMIRKGVNAEDYAHPLAGFKIVVDAGNGAGGFYANDVLKPLGADITGSQFLEPDGRFPNHIPNPENEEAMASVCAATVKAGADLGVIFDTDVDRGGAVDSRGEEINRNRLVAIASAIALEGNPGGTIVTDSITSDGLKTYIEQTLGGKHHRFKRGYKNVINEAVRLNNEGVNCPLAIETSGHAALRENYFLDDGAYLVTKIIIKAAQLRREGKSLDSLIADLKEAKEEKELRFPITAEDFRPYGESTIAALESYAKAHNWNIAPDNREGIRISFPENDGDGWFLLRMSVHDPILPLNIESNSVGGVRVLAEKLLKFFDEVKPENVDYAALREFLEK